MNFLFPGFLFALSTLAIPVIIHLFNFRKFKKVYFSNVSFLKEIQQQTSSSRNLKNILLLLSRLLILAFLVLAFARPYIPDESQQSNSFQQQAISVYIDNSYSMETLNKEGSLLDEAKRRAKEIASAYNINDKYQLLTNDFEGRHQRLLSYEEFVQAVDDVKISALSRNLQQVINRQSDVFSGEPNTSKTIYILSDFQKNFVPARDLTIDTSIAVRFVQLEANQLANISVDSVWFVSPVHRPNETERIVVQLKNNSDKNAENVPVKILIDGKPKALGSLNIESRSTSKDTLSFGGLRAGWKRGEVLITDYPVVFDDNFYFTFNVQLKMPVLAIHTASENPYINSLYQAEPFFLYQNILTGSINYSQLANTPLLILTATDNISTGLASQLKTYVRNGGSLMIYPSLDDNLSGLRTLTQTLGTDIPESVVSQDIKVSEINLQHPVFKGVFSQLPNKLDLPLAKKYVQFSNLSRTNKQSILMLPGRRSFLSQYSIGKGKVYLSAVSLSEASSNFVRHSVFVPIMYQIAFLSLRDNRLFYTLGKDQFLETNKITLSANQSLKLKKGKFEAIPDVRSSDNGTRLFVSDQIREKGVYQLLKGDSVLSVFAFNDNRSESDLSYLTKSELSKKLPDNTLEIFSPGRASIQNAIKAVNNGVQLWKLCLILALVFLAVEILLVRFYKTKDSKIKI
ncbi:BatA domain-containing protein [Pedobacter sp. P351]|uniref:BatA domain-containing protein n=1 Tax=Pedobacter superstes TaxID=3133441 RepID=UPI0030ADEAF5